MKNFIKDFWKNKKVFLFLWCLLFGLMLIPSGTEPATLSIIAKLGITFILSVLVLSGSILNNYITDDIKKRTKNKLTRIIEIYEDEEFLKADGFDDAVIGVDINSMRLIYSYSKCIDILRKRDEMTEEDAIEYFDYNVVGAYVGEKTPIWCDDFFE